MHHNLAGNELDEWAAKNGYRARFQGFLFPDTDDRFRRQIEEEMSAQGSLHAADRFMRGKCKAFDTAGFINGYLVATHFIYNYLLAIIGESSVGWEAPENLMGQFIDVGLDRYFDLNVQKFWWTTTSKLIELSGEYPPIPTEGNGFSIFENIVFL